MDALYNHVRIPCRLQYNFYRASFFSIINIHSPQTRHTRGATDTGDIGATDTGATGATSDRYWRSQWRDRYWSNTNHEQHWNYWSHERLILEQQATQILEQRQPLEQRQLLEPRATATTGATGTTTHTGATLLS